MFVAITCTQPRADQIVMDLKQCDVPAIAKPVLSVSYLDNPAPKGNYDAMLMTSAHVFGCVDLPDLPVIAVGQETAMIAKNRGFDVVQIGQGGVNDLDLTGFEAVLYPAAAEPTDIPDHAMHWPVYETILNPDFCIDESIITVAVFSVKAAQMIAPLLSGQHVVCLSQNIADSLGDYGAGKLAVCAKPEYAEMRQLICDIVEPLS